jgi:hypothetical protein
MSPTISLRKEGEMKGGHLVMSEKERDRSRVFSRVRDGLIKLKDASRILRMSYRQAKRVYKRFCMEGDRGLVHRRRGRVSNRRKDPSFRRLVIERYKDRYHGFGPTFASEKLLGEGLEVDHETLRRWLIAEGLWARRRRRVKHRRWRERKEHFGELVQFDGSFHEWFEGSGKKLCLMVMVDDATGTTFAMLFGDETTQGAMIMLQEWIKRYGIPRALYTDRKNIYITDREPTTEEILRGEKPLTAFGRVCKRLGIEIIPSYSPQARGRIERKNGVFQDRFVKELKLRGIRTLEKANKLLLEAFLGEINARFSLSPSSEFNFHRHVPEGMDLRRVFSIDEVRHVANDWTVRYHNRIFQIKRGGSTLPPAKNKVTVSRWLDGTIHIYYRGEEVPYEEISARPMKRRDEKAKSPVLERKRFVPPPDHPWRNFVFGKKASKRCCSTNSKGWK